VRTRSNDDIPDGFPCARRDESNRCRWVVMAIFIFAATGCSGMLGVRPSVAGYAVAPVNTMPVALDGYPRYYYNNRYTYLIDGQWYYPTNDGWVVFMEEPRTLSQYRTRLQTAPPATRAPDVYYSYPPPPSYSPQQPYPPQPRQLTPPQELRREYRPQ